MKLNEFYSQYSCEMYALVQRFAEMRFVRKNIVFRNLNIHPSVSFEVGSGESVDTFVATGFFDYLFKGKVYRISVSAIDHAQSTGGELVPAMQVIDGYGKQDKKALEAFQEVYDAVMADCLDIYETLDDHYRTAVAKRDAGEVVA